MWTGFRFKRFLISSLEMHLQIYREGGWLSSTSMILIMASWVNIGGMFNIASLSPHLEPSMSTTIMETPSKPSQHFPKRKSLFWVRILNILFVLWYCVLSVIKDGTSTFSGITNGLMIGPFEICGLYSSFPPCNYQHLPLLLCQPLHPYPFVWDAPLIGLVELRAFVPHHSLALANFKVYPWCGLVPIHQNQYL